MKVILDSREPKEIYNTMLKSMSLLKYSAMDIGDFQIISKGEIKILVERKTIGDYEASIKDHRKDEQFARICASGISRRSIYYLIEGDINKSRMKKALMTSIKNKKNRDHVNIIFSRDKQDTCRRLLQLTRDFISNKFFWESVDDTSERSKSYIECIKVKKVKNATPILIYRSTLMCIPGVSPSIAMAISMQFTSLHILINTLIRDGINTLVGIQIKQGRKIGKKLSEKIYYSFIENM